MLVRDQTKIIPVQETQSMFVKVNHPYKVDCSNGDTRILPNIVGIIEDKP